LVTIWTHVQGQAYLLGEELRKTTDRLGELLDKVTGASEGQGFQKLLELITSVVSGLQKALDLYNQLPDFGKLLINPVGQLAPLAGAAGQIPSTVRGGGTTVNNYNIKGAIDPQATARTITKVQNTANKTTGIKPFNFGFR
jgi:hypothetical protein